MERIRNYQIIIDLWEIRHSIITWSISKLQSLVFIDVSLEKEIRDDRVVRSESLLKDAFILIIFLSFLNFCWIPKPYFHKFVSGKFVSFQSKFRVC